MSENLVEIDEGKTHSYKYVMRKKRELYELQRKVDEKLRELANREAEFNCVCHDFIKRNALKIRGPIELFQFLNREKSLHRFMAYTEMPCTTTPKEYYEFCKEIVSSWNLKDIKELLALMQRTMNLDPLKAMAKICVDDARMYMRLYEVHVR
jgi:hypothetical protein